MDFFTLDSQLRRIAIFDQYESLIWTERFRLAGDFQMEIASDRNARRAMSSGTFCTVNNTQRVCQIETVVDTFNSEGARVLKLSGRGIEAPLLGDRVATPGMASLTATPNWTITGLPAAIARKVFNDICVTKINSVDDGIPFYSAGSIYEAGSIAEPSVAITIELEIDSVYNVLVKLCEIYKMGFRLARWDGSGRLYFDVYTGDNRTTLQTARQAVVFSPELDNLSDTSELTSVALQKTVAYVMSKNGSSVVYAECWDAITAVGFNRRVLFVKSDSELVAGAPLTAALQQLGKEQLILNRVVIAFDGEVPQFGSYSYGPSENEYSLGDLVEVRNSDGLSTNMRVDENIRTSDATGEKSYPTLVSELLITPGSWLAWDTAQYWADVPLTKYWADA